MKFYLEEVAMEELEKKNNEEINNEDLKEESKEVKENNEEKNEVVEGEDEVKEAVEGEIVEEEKKEEVMETAPDPSEFAIKADKVDDDTKEMLEQLGLGHLFAKKK